MAGDPEAFREIERLLTGHFDYQPRRIFIHRTVRLVHGVHVARDNPDSVLRKPAAPPLLGFGTASCLVAYVTAAKHCPPPLFVDHGEIEPEQSGDSLPHSP